MKRALEIFDKCSIGVKHGLETETQKEHYDIRIFMTGNEYREFRRCIQNPDTDPKALELIQHYFDRTAQIPLGGIRGLARHWLLNNGGKVKVRK